MRSLLVVAATSAEVAHVPASVEVLITGIGKTAAAIAVTRALATRRDLDGLSVINVGTAGALRPGIDGLHEPRVVINHELSGDELRALGYDPHERLELDPIRPGPRTGQPKQSGQSTRLGQSGQSRQHVDGARARIVLATGDAFVSDPRLRETLAARAHLVDMEGYAVALACRSFDVPVRLLKHVSDNADASALAWNDVVDRSARILGARVEELVRTAGD